MRCSEAASVNFLFALLQFEIKSTFSEQMSVICVEGELRPHPPATLSVDYSNVWHNIGVNQELGHEPGRQLCTESMEECLRNLLQHSSQREVGVGKKPTTALGGRSWSAGTCWLCWRPLRDCPDSTRVWVVSNKHGFCQTLSWYGWKWDWWCPELVPHLHVQQCGSSESPTSFFSCTSLWEVAVARFGEHDKPGTFPASVRKYSIYSCMG